MYPIPKEMQKLASSYDLVIEPSHKKNKKLDVYKLDGSFLVSVGDSRYPDWWIYKKLEGRDFADRRRKLYYQRHSKGIQSQHLAEVISWLILWNGD